MTYEQLESAKDLEEISEESYNAEMSRIHVLRAAAIEAAMKEETDQTKLADLKAELAAEYLKWKDIEIKKIQATRSEERKRHEESIQGNNREKRAIESKIDSNKLKLEELEAAHEEKMALIREHFLAADLTAQNFDQTLAGLGVTFGQSTDNMVSDLNRLLVKIKAAADLLRSYGGGTSSVTQSSYTGGSGWQASYETVTVPVHHSGGQYRAPTPGGEGLALLKDREWVLTEQQKARNDALMRGASPVGGMMGSQSITFYNNFQNEGDWNRFQSMMDTYVRQDNSKLIRRMGQNAQSRN